MKEIYLSLIIATRNRELILWETIKKGIHSLQNISAEIIIVNDSDHALALPELPDYNISILSNNCRGVAAARNSGAAHAKGKMLLFLDDDMWVNTEAINWILGRQIELEKEAAVYVLNWVYPGSLMSKLESSKIGRSLLSTGYNTMWGRMHTDGIEPKAGLYAFHTISSCSLVITKSLFYKVDKYNENIRFQGEDLEFSKKLQSLGIKIYAVFDTMLFHNQQDRLHLSGYLDRLNRGYASEFMAVQQGIIQQTGKKYTGKRKAVFELFRITEAGWILLFKLIPNKAVFDFITNRLLGMLSGLARYKAWREVLINKGI